MAGHERNPRVWRGSAAVTTGAEPLKLVVGGIVLRIEHRIGTGRIERRPVGLVQITSRPLLPPTPQRLAGELVHGASWGAAGTSGSVAGGGTTRDWGASSPHVYVLSARRISLLWLIP